jgi:hypothetical protein
VGTLGATSIPLNGEKIQNEKMKERENQNPIEKK